MVKFVSKSHKTVSISNAAVGLVMVMVIPVGKEVQPKISVATIVAE